jgi:two-component system phosphate regulon response regulator PhoB
MKKVLIVDDEPEVRRLVEVTLRSGDYEILQAEDAEKAIEIASIEMPDLIIMDVMMPGDMDGFEATRVLKNNPETKAITIVMLTARGQEADKEKGSEAGADDYFIKPFSPLELIQEVEGCLDK